MGSLVIKKKDIPLLEIGLVAFLYVIKNIYFIRNANGLLSGIELFENAIYVLALFTILNKTYKTKHFFLICGCVGVLLLCYLHTGQADLLKGFIVILSLKDLSSDDVFKTFGRIYLAGICLAILLYLLGISDPGTLRRNGIALGFATTNMASRIIQLILFLFLVSLGKSKSKYKVIAYCIIVAILTYITTKSRLSVLLMVAYPFVLSIVERAICGRRKIIWKNLVAVIPLILLILTIVLSQMYSNSTLVQSLNMAFSNRIYMNSVAIQKYGVTPFGTAANISTFSGIFDTVSNKYINFLTIDSQYIYMLVYYGFLGVALVIGSLALCIRKAWNHNDGKIVTVIILLSIYMFTETVGSVFGLPFLIYLSLGVEKREDNHVNNI